MDEQILRILGLYFESDNEMDDEIEVDMGSEMDAEPDTEMDDAPVEEAAAGMAHSSTIVHRPRA